MELEAEFTRRFREPVRKTIIKEEDACSRHPWNFKASLIFCKNPSQGCFQCQFEDELYEPGNGEEKKSKKKKQ